MSFAPEDQLTAAARRNGLHSRRWARRAGLLAGIAILVGALLLGAAIYAWPLPQPNLDQQTVLYGANGKVVARLYREKRTSVPLAEIPDSLREAVIDTEDVRFYRHGPFDWRGLARSAWQDLQPGGPLQGGSTLTQQLAKNLYLSNRRTLWRKAEEAVLAIKLSRHYSKDEILALYLNTVYFGEGAYGVQAASETYFGVPVQKLAAAQATLLAGLVQAPSAYDPFTHPDLARERQQVVLQHMKAAGDLTAAQMTALATADWNLRDAKDNGDRIASAAFVDAVSRELAQINPAWHDDIRSLGLRVDTTLNANMQHAAEQAVAQHLVKGRKLDGVLEPQVALVSLDPQTGAVRALLGGRDPKRAGFNRALDAKRQPGSTFKAFLYAAVLADKHTLLETKMCAKVTYQTAAGSYTPHDDNPKRPYHNAPLSVLRALAISDNTVAVRWTHDIGPDAVVHLAKAAGIDANLKPTLSVSLGSYSVTPLDLAAAYATFDNGGRRETPFFVTRVRDAAGHVLWQRDGAHGGADDDAGHGAAVGPPVMDPGVAFLVTYGLRNVIWSGTGHGLGAIVGRPVAGKTGTSDDQKDAWFVGYTPRLVTAVWVGDDHPAPLKGYGASLAGPVWAYAMHGELKGLPTKDWPTPDDVVWVKVAPDGLLPNATSDTRNVPFLKGTEPTQVSPDWDWQRFYEKLKQVKSWDDFQALLQPVEGRLAQAPDWLRQWISQQWWRWVFGGGSETQPGAGSGMPPGGSGSESAPGSEAPPWGGGGGGSEVGPGGGGSGSGSGGSEAAPGAGSGSEAPPGSGSGGGETGLGGGDGGSGSGPGDGGGASGSGPGNGGGGESSETPPLGGG